MELKLGDKVLYQNDPVTIVEIEYDPELVTIDGYPEPCIYYFNYDLHPTITDCTFWKDDLTQRPGGD